MALVTCRECKGQVSSKASSCPHCGAPVKSPGNPLWALVQLAAGIAVFYYLWTGFSGKEDKTPSGGQLATATPEKPAQVAPACKTSWRLCKDNADLVNNSDVTIKAQVACKSAGDRTAKFGSPTWPWFAFGSFHSGDDAVRNGKLVLVEKDAQFQNQFGAMQHVIVNCTYDLNEGSASVDILPL